MEQWEDLADNPDVAADGEQEIRVDDSEWEALADVGDNQWEALVGDEHDKLSVDQWEQLVVSVGVAASNGVEGGACCTARALPSGKRFLLRLIGGRLERPGA